MSKEEPIKYEALLLGLAVNEFKRGFKVKRTCKATKKGTSVIENLMVNIEHPM